MFQFLIKQNNFVKPKKIIKESHFSLIIFYPPQKGVGGRGTGKRAKRGNYTAPGRPGKEQRLRGKLAGKSPQPKKAMNGSEEQGCGGSRPADKQRLWGRMPAKHNATLCERLWRSNKRSHNVCYVCPKGGGGAFMWNPEHTGKITDRYFGGVKPPEGCSIMILHVRHMFSKQNLFLFDTPFPVS